MMAPADLTAFLASHGLWLLAPAALVEGPVATIVAGALVAQGTLGLAGVLAVATAADLAGDTLLWLAGRNLRRYMPQRLRRRILSRMPPQSLRRNAGRILVFGKLTHSAGALVLLAAGMARVPLLPFVGYNLLATLPKVAALTALGWGFGLTLALQGGWLMSLLPLILFLIALGTLALWLRKTGKRPCASAA